VGFDGLYVVEYKHSGNINTRQRASEQEKELIKKECRGSCLCADDPPRSTGCDPTSLCKRDGVLLDIYRLSRFRECVRSTGRALSLSSPFLIMGQLGPMRLLLLLLLLLLLVILI
jgi:hypothetical protein